MGTSMQAVGAASLGSACAGGQAGSTKNALQHDGAVLDRQTGTGAPVAQLRTEPIPTVRIGIVGCGARGRVLLRLLLRLAGCEVRALADIDQDALAAATKLCVDAGRPEPTRFAAGEHDYRRLCGVAELDLVIIATPWRWHVPMAVEAMRAGKHVGVEVPAAYTVEGCWQLVETAEATRRHCMMLENCCYGREELMVLNMVRKGLFGELLHGEAAYIHDLRKLLFSGESEGLWRTAHSMIRDGNFYPTHGLGPVAQYMNINRGDRLAYLNSMSGPAMGMHLYAEREFGAGSPQAQLKFKAGDINHTMIRSERGRTIVVQHDTTSPRPYTRHNLIQGTSGTFRGYGARIFVEGRSKPHAWDDIENYRAEFEHPLWAAMQAEAEAAGGHGGMDFVMLWRLITCLREGWPLDQNVYDGATWSVISPLSELSVAQRGAPIDVPDFTRGAWRSLPSFELTYA